MKIFCFSGFVFAKMTSFFCFKQAYPRYVIVFLLHRLLSVYFACCTTKDASVAAKKVVLQIKSATLYEDRHSTPFPFCMSTGSKDGPHLKSHTWSEGINNTYIHTEHKLKHSCSLYPCSSSPIVPLSLCLVTVLPPPLFPLLLRFLRLSLTGLPRQSPSDAAPRPRHASPWPSSERSVPLLQADIRLPQLSSMMIMMTALVQQQCYHHCFRLPCPLSRERAIDNTCRANGGRLCVSMFI